MTHFQKERIASLRGEGASYAQIAAALGKSKNTIQAHCRRYGLGSGVSIKYTGRVCDHCGKRLATSSRKNKRFCSDACRLTWWKEHPEALDRKAIYSFACSCCGAAFDSYGNSHRKYCSRTCYARAKTILAVEVATR